MGRTLYHNGTVITLDDRNRIASCLLVEGGAVKGVFDSPDACPPAGDLRMVDLRGRTVIPGFNDNHIHLSFLGDSLDSLHFPDMAEGEIVDLLKERFKGIKKGAVVFGYDWDYPACADPRKEALDAAFPGNPVILSQYGGHNLWVNSHALRKMGIDRNTPDPAGGIICRDGNGEPTGILKDIQDNAYLNAWFIRRLVNPGINRANYLKAMRTCSEYGCQATPGTDPLAT